MIAQRLNTFIAAIEEAGTPQGITLRVILCGDGYYALRFAQPGFSVPGYYARASNGRLARFAARFCGVNMDFETANFNDLRSTEAIQLADVAACLGHFIHALNQLLVLET